MFGKKPFLSLVSKLLARNQSPQAPEPAPPKEEPAGPAPLPPDVLEAFNLFRACGERPFICSAPFVNLFFQPDGSVLACCHNISYVLGSYPAQGLKEIWQGEPVRRMRRMFTQGNLPEGCEFCRVDFELENFQTLRAVKYDSVPVHEDYPSMMEFNLSMACNLRCIMCVGELPDILPEKHYDEGFLEELEDFLPHLRQARFTGGEPFVNPLYPAIWDRLAAVNPDCAIAISTNGTILNRRVRKLLSQAKVSIHLSLDSLQKERFEKIRRGADFDSYMENFRFFHAYCRERGTRFGISISPQRENWQEIPDLIRFANELDTYVWLSMVWLPHDESLRTLPPDEIQEIMDVLGREELPDDTPTRFSNRMYYQDFLNLLAQWKKQGIAEEENRTREVSAEYVKGLVADALLARLEADEGPAAGDEARRLKESLDRAFSDFPESCAMGSYGLELFTQLLRGGALSSFLSQKPVETVGRAMGDLIWGYFGPRA